LSFIRTSFFGMLGVAGEDQGTRCRGGEEKWGNVGEEMDGAEKRMESERRQTALVDVGKRGLRR